MADVTSATGTQPRNPPDLYAPQEMARGLVALALKPRGEVTVGLEAKAIEVLFALARPVADRVLVLVERYYSSGREPAPVPGALHAAAGDGRAAGGLHGRPSLWRLLRLRA